MGVDHKGSLVGKRHGSRFEMAVGLDGSERREGVIHSEREGTEVPDVPLYAVVGVCCDLERGSPCQAGQADRSHLYISCEKYLS